MITAVVNSDLYRYEIHAMIREFCPGTEVRVIVRPGGADLPRKGAGLSEDSTHVRAGGAEPNIEIPAVCVEYQPDRLTVSFRVDAFAGGDDGAQGAEGAQGAKGAQGAQGAQEAEEAQGAQGAQEAEGAHGIPDSQTAAPYGLHSSDPGEAPGIRTVTLPAPAGISFAEKGQELKAELKHILYDTLSEITGKRLPWGELIGIRPTKLVTRALRAGRSAEEAEEELIRVHRVSREKAELAAEIALREESILGRLDTENGYSLYIGVPFCPTTCLYCSFPSFAIEGWKTRVGDYLTALEREMAAVSRIMEAEGKHPDTIYVGGGTPTTLEPAELERLCRAIRRFFPGKVLEFTVEAGRPDSITREKLRVLREYGVTRMSVNPQTMHDRTLWLIGRRHTVQQTVEAFHMAREAGMDNINMDIILGLPGETDEDVRTTLEQIAELGPDDLTVHSLAVKRGSRMQQFIESRGYDALHSSITDRTVEIAAEGAARMGLVPYYLYRQKNMSGNFENVGYARLGRILPDGSRTPDRFGIYNILIIEEIQSIVALGPGSVSKCVRRREDGSADIARCDDAKDIPTYIDHIDEMIARKKRLFSI